MQIISYNYRRDIDVYFEDYNWIYYHARYDDFQNGQIKCPYEPRLYGVGYIGEGRYKTKENGKHTKCYNTWNGMLERCYSNTIIERRPTYQGCTVCEEWHNFQNFAKWYEDNYYEVENEKMCLDKDILYKNNKIYSPSTCVFTPNRINVLFTKSDKARSGCLIGVTWHKRDKIYEARMSYINNKCKKDNIYLGRYSTQEEAFQVYKKAKENYIKKVADEYRYMIPIELYKAMYRYEVEIKD